MICIQMGHVHLPVHSVPNSSHCSIQLLRLGGHEWDWFMPSIHHLAYSDTSGITPRVCLVGGYSRSGHAYEEEISTEFLCNAAHILYLPVAKGEKPASR